MREVPQQVELTLKDTITLIELLMIWNERNCSTFISGARLVLSDERSNNFHYWRSGFVSMGRYRCRP